MMKEKRVKIGSLEINYAEGPKSGPAIILLHGLPGRWQEFMPIMPALMLQWHILALDFRGQGKSGRIPGQYQYKYYVADVAHFIEVQLNEPAILFGHSAGGVVALSVAAKMPERVRALIIGDSPIDMNLLNEWMTSEGFINLFSELQKFAGLDNYPVQEITREIANIAIQVPGQDDPIRYGDTPGVNTVHIQQFANTLQQMDPGVLEYHATGRPMEFLDGFDLDRTLKKVACPTLLLQGNPSLGGMMTNDAIEHVRSILPDADHSFLETSGHDLGLETWEVAPLLQDLMSFLDVL